MNSLNLGVVGVGHLGSLHTKILAEIDSVKLVGVFDADAEKARKST